MPLGASFSHIKKVLAFSPNLSSNHTEVESVVGCKIYSVNNKKQEIPMIAVAIRRVNKASVFSFLLVRIFLA